MRHEPFLSLAAVLALFAGPAPSGGPAPSREAPMTLALVSPAFSPNGSIPKEYTCDGDDLAPPLAWTGAPAGTKSFALIVDDPDAPMGTWVHWVLYNIPTSVNSLPEGGARSPVPASAREGLNDGGDLGYTGPCPPIGRHRYFHTLYALDTVLPDLGARATREDLDAAMRGHVLEQAQVMGTYQRQGKGKGAG